VRVVERDSDLSVTGGYKLHLGVPAVAALREMLPPTLVEALLGSAVGTRGFSLAVRDHRGRQLLRAAESSNGLTLDVDRITLRRLLALGLEDRLLLGRSCQRWRLEGQTVFAELDDGSEVEADVLVIADGAGSRLAEQLAGRPTSSPCGLVGVAGRTALQSLPHSTRTLLGEGPMLAIGPGGTGLFATAHDPVGRAAVRTCLATAATRSPIAIWGLIAVEGGLPPDLMRLDPPSLVKACTQLLQRQFWADRIVSLLTCSEVPTVSAYRLNAADPDDLAPWPSSRVTAVGDAVHAMPPTGGQGAATAILDAHALVQQLHAAAQGDLTTVVAVHDYETRLRVHAGQTVRESLQPVRWIRATATPGGAIAVRALTPVLALGAAAVHTVARSRR
jgi:2-polyprenyl-6-methoxyphenol hydroxylase-like FAD-dependent oxidoreductase